MCTACMPSTHGGQKRASKPLELELQSCGCWGIEPGSSIKQQLPLTAEPCLQLNGIFLTSKIPHTQLKHIFGGFHIYLTLSLPVPPRLTLSMTPLTSSQIYDLLFFIYSNYTYMRPTESMQHRSMYMCFRSDHLGLDKLLELFCPWKNLIVPLIA